MQFDFNRPIDTITTKIESWVEAFISMLPNMVVAIFTFILFLLLAKLGKKLASKLFHKTTADPVIRDLLSKFVYFIIIGAGIFVILGVLKLEKAVFSLMAGIGVIGLALGFAFQDIVANFIAGIILAFRKPFRLGEIVEIHDIMGKVLRTNLRVTTLLTFRGQEVYIPNKEVIQNNIINYSAQGQRRIDIPIGISFGENLEKVEKVVSETIGNIDGVLKDKDIIFDYFEYGDSSINFYIRFWINYPDQPGFLSLRSKAIKEIKKAFDENDITIPFPIRTLDFGIKGGQKLTDLNLRESLSFVNSKS